MRATTTLRHPQGGLLSELIGSDLAAKKLAFKVALAKSARGLEKDIEDGLRSVGLPKLAPLMASAAYPNREGVGSFEALAVVYVKAGPVYQAAIRSAIEGASIKAHGGKFLAIPTNYNMPGGQRRSLGAPNGNVQGSVRVTPQQMVESGAAFLVKRKGGPGFHWMLRVAAQPMPPNRNGRRHRSVVISPALARELRFGTSRAALREGGTVSNHNGRKRVAGLLKVGAVPLFTLVPEVTVRARLNGPALIARRFNEIQSRYDDEFRRITSG